VSPHLEPDTVNDDVENRCIYLGGPGGTGKSQVIKAIIEAFRQLNCSEQLLVCATTGVAANLTGGSTVDSLLKLE
jgi:ABC-type ATPase involved in cell division